MFQKSATTCFCVLEPDQLDNHFVQALLTKLRGRFEKTCSRTKGYIHSVERILSVGNHHILEKDARILFEVTVSLKIIPVGPGRRIRAKIDLLFDQGLLASLEKIKIIVPISSRSLEEDHSLIQPGQYAWFLIVDFQQNLNEFSCIGSLCDGVLP
jgi:DNA-directed RNA polymerase subunit E'/Rpb7